MFANHYSQLFSSGAQEIIERLNYSCREVQRYSQALKIWATIGSLGKGSLNLLSKY
jgi:hypothetical protein